MILWWPCRNYRPQNELLAEAVVDKAEAEDVESLVQEQLSVAANSEPVNDQVVCNDLLNTFLLCDNKLKL